MAIYRNCVCLCVCAEQNNLESPLKCSSTSSSSIILPEGFLYPFSTTRGLSTLLAGFAYRKMDLRTQTGLCEPLPEARYMLKSEF